MSMTSQNDVAKYLLYHAAIAGVKVSVPFLHCALYHMQGRYIDDTCSDMKPEVLFEEEITAGKETPIASGLTLPEDFESIPLPELESAGSNLNSNMQEWIESTIKHYGGNYEKLLAFISKDVILANSTALPAPWKIIPVGEVVDVIPLHIYYEEDAWAYARSIWAKEDEERAKLEKESEEELGVSSRNGIFSTLVKKTSNSNFKHNL